MEREDMYRKTISVALVALLLLSSTAVLSTFASSSDVASLDTDVDPAIDDLSSVASGASANTLLLNRFIENDGQWSSDIVFAATTSFGSAAFTSHGFYYCLLSSDNTTEVVSFLFINASDVTPAGVTTLSSTSNYLIGSDPSAWHTNVPEYSKITYSNLWNGIDLTFYFVNGELKYEFSVDAGVSADSISISVDGADISVQSGDLVISTAGNMLTDSGLIAYYADDNRSIGASFVASGNVYSFSLDGRDISKAVVIDPLVYSTYLGGSGDGNTWLDDTGYAITVDSSGCAYAIGQTTSSNFPTVSGGYKTGDCGAIDVFITKFSADGSSLIFSTYFGGDGADYGRGIAVDSSGHVYVAGYSESENLPMFNSYQSDNMGWTDVFVTELSADGSSLLYSTYLGGSGDEYGLGLAIDSGYVYVTGFTTSDSSSSPAYPTTVDAEQTTSSSYDAFISKINTASSGVPSLVYSTYLGGSGYEYGYGIDVESGIVYVTGMTTSSDLTIVGGYQTAFGGIEDAFVAKINTAVSGAAGLTYSSYLGGTQQDVGNGIDVVSGNAYVTGLTSSSNFPTRGAYKAANNLQDAFVAKINTTSSGSASLVYSTYLGGTSTDSGNSIAVDSSGCAYVTGSTSSSYGFPITSGASQTVLGGGSDAFVTKLDSTGASVIYSTYLGGTGNDVGRSIALDSSGGIYLTGETFSSNFPTKGAEQSAFGGGASDAFITKMTAVGAPSAPSSLSAVPGKTNVTLSWVAPDDGGASIDYYLVYQDGVQVKNTTSTSCVVNGLTTGHSYKFNVSAHNSVGYGAKSTITVTPNVYLTVNAAASSQYANASNAASITATVSASITSGSITLKTANVSHYVDGVLTGNSAISVSGSSYSGTPSLTLEVGTNVFTFTFNDSAGNSVSRSVTVIYDETDPAISITSPSGGAYNTTGSVTVCWTSSDDLAGIARYNVSVLHNGIWSNCTVASSESSKVLSGLTNGPYTVYVAAIDKAGNVNVTSVSFTVDAVKPVVEITSPVDSSYNNTGSVTMTWSSSDPTSGVKSVEYSTDGETWTAIAGNEYVWSGLADGSYTFYLRATDNAGNVNTTSVSFTVDTVRPVVTITSPSNNTNSNDNEMSITWTASDAASGVGTVMISLDGESWAPGDSSYSLPSSTPDGSYTFYVRATDNAGNVNETSVSFVIDTVRPNISITSPAGGSYNSTSNVTIAWTGSDDRSGIANYTVSVFYNVIRIDFPIESSKNSKLLSNLANGLYVVNVTAVDRAGNVNTTSVSFTVDNVKPTVEITSPLNSSYNNTGSVTIAWFIDDDSGINSIEYSINGEDWTSIEESGYAWSGLADGSHTFYVRVTDMAGNVNETSVTFVVDTVRPTLTISSPANGSFNNTGSATVAWIGGDDRSGIACYRVSVLHDGTWQNFTIASSDSSKQLSGLADGSYTVYVTAIDKAGNVNTTSLSFIVDTVRPVVSITSPSTGSYNNTGSVSVTWTCSDDRSGMAKVEYSLDGIAWSAIAENEYTWSGLANGSHTFHIRATDYAGNVNETSVSFIVSLGIDLELSPASPAYTNDNEIAVTITASDSAPMTTGNWTWYLNGILMDWNSTDVFRSNTSVSVVIPFHLEFGINVWCITVNDSAGNSVVRTITIVYDVAVPSISITSPANGSYNDTGSVMVIWTGTDSLAGIAYYNVSVFHDGAWTNYTVASIENSKLLSGLADGAYTIYVTAMDKAGNSNATSITIVVDKVRPTVEIASPADGSFNSTGTVTIDWSFADDRSGVYSVEYSIDGVAWTSIEGNEYVWSGLADGTYTFHVKVTDNAGNVNETSVSFVVDSVRPALTIDSPKNESFNNTGSVNMTWTGSDDRSGISGYEVCVLHDGAWTNYTGLASNVAGQQLSGLADGSYTVFVKAFDKSGNSNTTSISFVVDTVRPVVSISSPSTGSYNNTGSAIIVWTSTDDRSGIRSMEYSLDGIAWTAMTENEYIWSSLADGTYTFHVRVTDNAGNSNETSISFIVDLTKPTVSIMSPSDGSYNGTDSVRVIWTGSDDLAGMAYYKVCVLHDGAWSNYTIASSDSSRLLSGLADGSYKVRVIAVDKAGNENISEATFIVDTKAPTLVSNTPDGSDARVGSTINVTFSEAMNASQVSIVIDGVGGTIAWNTNGTVAVFTPSSPLAYGTRYTVIVSGTDLAGNALSSSWSFATLKNEGKISGTLKDPQGNALANATITLSNGMTTTTDINGHFEFDNVTSGSYNVTISKDGYQTVTQGVSTSAGTTSDLGALSIQSEDPSDDNTVLIFGAVLAVVVVLGILLVLVRRKKDEKK